MINSTICVTCNNCKNKISIKIKSIDELQNENEILKQKIRNLEIKLSAKEFMDKNSSYKNENDKYYDMFKEMFGGNKK